MRQFDGNTYRGMSAQTKALIDGFGAQKAAAGKTRVDHVSLSNYGNRNHDQMMPIDVMADLMKASGDFELLEYLAGLFDKSVIDRPTGATGSVRACIAAYTKEATEAISVAVQGIQNGGFDGDVDAAIKEVEEALQAGADLLATLKDRKAGGA